MSRRREFFDARPDEDDDIEEEQEEEEFLDEKDMIIRKQEEMIKKMRKEFSDSIETMRKQFIELVDESTDMQEGMLERIKQLKEEIEKYRTANQKIIEKRGRRGEYNDDYRPRNQYSQKRSGSTRSSRK